MFFSFSLLSLENVLKCLNSGSELISSACYTAMIPVGLFCCRCRVPGMYYFVFHATLGDKLCVLMKLDDNLLTSFCDPRRRKQVRTWSDSSICCFYVILIQEIIKAGCYGSKGVLGMNIKVAGG